MHKRRSGHMPTAAKLVASVCMALLTLVISHIIIGLMPPETQFGHFILRNVGIGLSVGWMYIGARAGRGWNSAITNGVTGIFLLVAWGLLIYACMEMFKRSMLRHYASIEDAIGGIGKIVIEYGVVLLNIQLILVLLCGGCITACAAEYAAKKWR